MKSVPFDLQDVRLFDGPFRTAQALHAGVLLAYEPDRLLAGFRREAGLPPKAPAYEGWEAYTIAGHSLGHYLSGCSLMYASTGDPRFRGRVSYAAEDLAACQAASGCGCIGAIPGGRALFEERIARGDIKVENPFHIHGVWVPFYTHHKVLAGLRDAHRLCGDAAALDVGRRFGLWIEGVVAGLDDEQMQQILACEHGGMNEVLADLWADTGDARFLALSRRFHHKAVLGPLSLGQDCLPGLHANTQIPKFAGLAVRHLLAGDEDDRRTAEFAWDRVANHHSYVTGGHCLNEHFGPPDRLNDRLGENTSETCNVYNMLKLTRFLFGWTGSAAAADFYERALFNHIRATQHPNDGRVVYNLTLEMGGYKRYQNPFGFTCCVGTGMESHARYGEGIYAHGGDDLTVNLFIASEVRWAGKGVRLRQETRFPEDDRIHLRWACERPVALTLSIRYPRWAEEGMDIAVNGSPVEVTSEPSSYVRLRRTWSDGDAVTIRVPMTLRLETMPDNPARVAVFHGPLLLAGDLGAVDDPAAAQAGFVPALDTGGRPPSEWLEPVPGRPSTFRLRGVGRPRDVELRPFCGLHDRRYTVYWDCLPTRDSESGGCRPCTARR